jgi:hypothetical protein
MTTRSAYTLDGYTDDESDRILAHAAEVLDENPGLTYEQALEKSANRLGLMPDRTLITDWCRPPMLALHAGQTWTCTHGAAWITVDAIDEGRGNKDWFVKWATA